jgi:hypothetical protein
VLRKIIENNHVFMTLGMFKIDLEVATKPVIDDTLVHVAI